MMACMVAFICSAQETDSLLQVQQQIDSIENSLKYQHGTVQLKNGIASIKVPEGYKFLDAEQAEWVLVDLWGNRPGENMSLGMIMPEHHSIFSDSGYVFNIQYDEIGYIKDDDADKINYKDLLKEIQDDAKTENKIRIEERWEPIEIVGWASQPFYDKDRKVLHWAKEVKFGEREVNTLNYNIRILGRKGVLVLNAISSMPYLDTVKADISKVLDIVSFNEGFAYNDYKPGVDEVAAWTIGGLVAGKVLAKAGVFAILLKFWKLIAVGAVAAGGFITRMFRKNKDEEPALVYEPVQPEENENPDSKV